MTVHQPVLSVRGLRKCYADRTAVDGINLSIARGERVAMVGPNGAGKTTTLMSCLGLVRPDGGTIELLGARTPQARRAALAGVGFTAGYLPLPARVRVIEYLTVFGRLYGLRAPRKHALAGLSRFGIEDLARRMGNELSSGQRTLVGLVKAIMHKPALLVLDEPTSSLDPDVALRARQGLIEQCEADGAALLITSHNMAEVERLAQRIVFLFAGRIVIEGSVDQVTRRLGHATLEDTYLALTESHRQTVSSAGV